ncbi:hypothetical protein [Cytobacillus sp. Bac17]|nr:hypothetical protein [Cytobacillus sp. Bac17]
MAEAMIYMFFVGFGVTAGAGCAALIGFKIWQRMNNRTPKKRKGAAF